jgi:hypothetical protein
MEALSANMVTWKMQRQRQRGGMSRRDNGRSVRADRKALSQDPPGQARAPTLHPPASAKRPPTLAAAIGAGPSLALQGRTAARARCRSMEALSANMVTWKRHRQRQRGGMSRRDNGRSVRADRKALSPDPPGQARAPTLHPPASAKRPPTLAAAIGAGPSLSVV